MIKQIKAVVALFAICAVTAILLALTNHFAFPIIKQNNDKKANEALLVVLPSGEDFKKVDLSKYTLPSTVVEAYTEKNGGCVVKLETAGYAAGLVIMCGVNADGTVSGAVCLGSGETLGHEKTYGDKFKGLDGNGVMDVATVSGATYTTSAYKNAVKDAINAATIIGGGTADLRSEEEILAENLANALPSAEGKFSQISYIQMFIANNAIDAIYTAENGSGSVYVIGKIFVGIDAEGNILTTEIDDSVKAKVEQALTAINAAEAIDLTKYEGLHTSVKAARKHADGSITMQVNGSGYGINGGDKWHPASGKPIVICLTIAKDGSITKCVTMAQEETPTIGGVCGESSFYSQFNGKTEGNYKDVNLDALSKATYTKNGYMNAIKNAFAAINILNGGAANE